MNRPGDQSSPQSAAARRIQTHASQILEALTCIQEAIPALEDFVSFQVRSALLLETIRGHRYQAAPLFEEINHIRNVTLPLLTNIMQTQGQASELMRIPQHVQKK